MGLSQSMDRFLPCLARRLPPFALLALAAVLAAPAQAADERALADDGDRLAAADRAPDVPLPVQPAPARFLQDSEVNEDILLPPARPQDDDPDRTWSRDYFGVAVGVISVPRYNGADDNRILPGFYVRGRVSGYSFSTRGTNLQVNLIRQRSGRRLDWKFGPLVNLRSDRSGRVKDDQVDALGKRKLAVEAGFSAGVSYTGVLTSKYDQIGARVVALKDISGRHGSWVVSPTVEYGTPISKRAFIGLSASVNIYGKGFGRYYYDIDPAGSAASGLPVYDAAGRKTTVGKYQIGLAGAYALSGDLRKGLALIGGLQYGRMASRFARSPIVSIAGDRDQWIAGGGVAYQF